MSVDREGPLLIEGPVEVVTDDGTVAASDRFVVAVCACGLSGTYPWCDTSHRAREPRHDRHAPCPGKSAGETAAEGPTAAAGSEPPNEKGTQKDVDHPG
ncbi:CDGSH iron-sulfur domain-containing protein [Streptomyces sp. KK5PA1]|uniref:CDGSH iron-sulfur domain-containing protein n=1 Tax=Actinacidiphila acididurans TaxID=2784346 RepID=A0ABS2TSF4_9ACTN|nr:CDGSH iron-sulfur domain-containing protein [Actinacidiphila acididurans]